MTVDIDAETGLPKLPEDHFWDVVKVYRDNNPYYIMNRIGPDYRARVSIKKRTEITTIWKRPFDALKDFWRPFADRTVTEKRMVDVVVFQDIVLHEVEVPATSEVVDGVEQVVEARKTWAVLEADALTPELLLNTAIRVYTTWQETIRAQELFGEYPPKKLETE